MTAMPSQRLRPVVKILRLQGFPLLKQLRLEEALLRADPSNWWLVNDGAAEPTVVLGISGKPDQLVHLEKAKEKGIPLIKRYSGGGTVIVDGDTVLSTLILKAADLPYVEKFPGPIMAWSEDLYRPVFSHLGEFRARENDYVLGHVKFGGNAQAITKNKFVHHTSFLWHFQSHHMEVLKLPAKQPAYREGREHADFLCSLRDKLPTRAAFIESIRTAIAAAGFDTEEASLDEAEHALQRDHIKSTRVII